MFGGAFSGFGGQLFGNWRFRAKRRFRARVDPLAFSRFWAFLENFEGGGELEPPLFPPLLIIFFLMNLLCISGEEAKTIQ